MEEQDTLNYLLGQYIGIAINNPKKYPKKPFLSNKNKSKKMTDEDMEKVARNWR